MNYCRECGKILDENQKECPFCGTYLGDQTAKEETGLSSNPLNQTNPGPSTDNSFNYSSSGPGSSQDYGYKTTTDYSYSSMGGTGSMNNNPYSPMVTEPLNNWVKVILSFVSSWIPLVGIIAGIIFMVKEDQDRKSFGQALLTMSIVVFVLCCICCVILASSGALAEMNPIIK
ncbi:MAG TPA: hypothetical protein PLC16_00315 [Defluviitaleaceae bacterium]|nr:hypothetical protein [Defluviitaleaceae bacterium]HPT75161.1 hypothetical protein [Defluviitaleaceae bacterium]